MIKDIEVAHLQPWVRASWERAYAGRPRIRSSREDLLYGFVAGMLTTYRASVVLTTDGVETLLSDPPATT